MRDKILSAIRTGVGKTSINDKTLNAYVSIIADKITDESQISEAIKPYVEVLKEFQGNINSVASSAATEKESSVKAEYDKKIEDLTKANPNPQDPNKEVPEWQKAIEGLTATVQTLASTVGAQQVEKTHETLFHKLNGILSEKKVPEWYSSDILDGRTLKDENEMGQWADKISSKWGERNQELANQGFQNSVPPAGGNSETKESEDIAKIIDQGTKQIVEQQKQN